MDRCSKRLKTTRQTEAHSHVPHVLFSIQPILYMQSSDFLSPYKSIFQLHCIDSLYVATHQRWHLWRGGSSMPSVTLLNSYSHPRHRKDSWWVVHWFGAQKPCTWINRQNNGEVKPPQLDRNIFLPTASAELLELTKQEVTFLLCSYPPRDRCDKYSSYSTAT